jgi:putative nucleotidyltransferase with HDIG domain
MSVFGSFRARLILVLVFSMLFVGLLNNLLIYEYSRKMQFDDLRKQLIAVSQTAALMIDPRALASIALNREGMSSPQYQAIVEKLQEIQKINPQVADIYIMGKTEKPGILHFIVDPSALTGRRSKKGVAAYPGDEYDARQIKQMLAGFSKPTADERLIEDDWGVSLSGYAPIRDEHQQTIALLGLDMSAASVHALQWEVKKRAVLVLLLAIIICLILSLELSKKINRPIKNLVEATRCFSQGKLTYRAVPEGANEIKELAQALNEMAQNLDQARKEVLGYFYRMVQSLVRVLEARDAYTKGHSDRVCAYAEKTAQKIGLSTEKMQLLKDAALLHDIGKVGIQEMILNKGGRLTDDERLKIEKHPEIGEDILRPISLNDEILSIIRGHHERYDGTGYPDGLSGDKINLLSAIISVVDAYDAMTSHRAYRTNLSDTEAAAQLQAGSGRQFNPQVVAAFLQVLAQERHS